jgi:hypothetical protein
MSEETKDQVEASEAAAPASQPEAEAEAPEAKADETKGDAAASEAADQSKTSVQQSEDDDAVLDATGRERPRFLLGFPQHPDLTRLAAAFEAGNYALVREEAEALAERTDNPAVRDAALELRRRIDPDPLAKYLLALTAALLLFLAYFAYHH